MPFLLGQVLGEASAAELDQVLQIQTPQLYSSVGTGGRQVATVGAERYDPAPSFITPQDSHLCPGTAKIPQSDRLEARGGEPTPVGAEPHILDDVFMAGKNDSIRPWLIKVPQ